MYTLLMWISENQHASGMTDIIIMFYLDWIFKSHIIYTYRYSVQYNLIKNILKERA